MLDILADADLAGTESLLVGALLDPDVRVGRRAAEILLSRQPWLALEPFSSRPVPPRARKGRFGAAWGRLRKAVKEAARGKPGGRRLPFERFARLPGLLPDLLEELEAAGLRGEARSVRRRAEALRGEKRPGQILFSLTYSCNLSCPYCYAKGWQTSFPGHMTRAAFREAALWCRRQGVGRILLEGGEPTVHPEFGKLLDEARRLGLRISLTSNGLFGPAVRARVKAPQVPEFICHVTPGVLRDRRLLGRLRANLKAAVAARVRVGLRCTLTGPGRALRTATLDLARAAGVRRVYYGFAFRNMGRNNEYYAYPGRGGGSFDATLNRFMDEAGRAGVELSLSKPFPLCCVTAATLRRMLGEGGLRTACTASQRGFSKNLTVNPDLTTLPCNALGKAGPRLTQFRDLGEAGRFHGPLLRALYARPWRPRCRRCALYWRGLCQGVCLAERYSGISTSSSKRRLR